MEIWKPNSQTRARIALIATNFFVETNRLESLAAVYLIEFKQWDVVWVGYMSLILNLLMIVAQTPAGDLMDMTRHKTSITAAAIVVASITTTAIVWTSNLYYVILIKAVEGIAATIFLPALMSILLGVIPNDDVPRMVSLTEVSNKIGSLVFTCGTGFIAYYAYPDVTYAFYFLGAGGLVAAFCTLAIPSNSIDFRRARGSIVLEGVQFDLEKKSSSQHKIQMSHYKDLLRDRSMTMFAILTFFYHFFHAAVAPLVSQITAKQDKRSGLAFTSGVLGVAYLVQAPTAYMVGRSYKRFGYKNILLVGFSVFPIRCGINALLAIYFPNQWAFVATQVFEGLGAGIYDTLAPLVVKSIVKGSGPRFGFTYGFIVTCWRLGHGLSVLCAEAILEAAGGRYQVPFLFLGGGGILVTLMLIFGFKTPPIVAYEGEGEDGPKVFTLDDFSIEELSKEEDSCDDNVSLEES